MGKHNQKEIKRPIQNKDKVFGSSGYTGKSVNFLMKDVLGNIYSKTEKLIGFYEPCERNAYRIMIPFKFDGTDYYEVIHNLNIKQYINVLFIDSIGIQSLYQLLHNEDTTHGYNGFAFNLESNKLSFGGDAISLNNKEGFIILEYTKNNLIEGNFCADDIPEIPNLNLIALGNKCLTYTEDNKPIELIDVLLKFEEEICEFRGFNQVQSDWNEQNTTSPSYIKNKPSATIPTHTGEVTGDTELSLDKTAITNKQTIINNKAGYLLISDENDDDTLKKIHTSSLPSATIPTHTGEVTGNTELSLDKTAITNKPDADATDSVNNNMFFLVSDGDDNDTLKKVRRTKLNIIPDAIQNDKTTPDYIKNNLVLDLAEFNLINQDINLSGIPFLDAGYYTFSANLNITFSNNVGTSESVLAYLEDGGSTGANNSSEMYLIVKDIIKTGDTRETKAKIFEFHTFHKGLVGTWVISYFGATQYHMHSMYTNTKSTS